MDIWFLSDLQRLSQERAAVARLEASAEWLVGTAWLLDGGLLCLDAIIRAHGHDYQVRMIYPDLFPSVPLTVYPRHAEARWSDHQYGSSDGPLCLEWGPDNWHSAITGAQMLESAHKLLHIENPLGRGRAAEAFVAPSRHYLSVGQELRASYGRFYIGHALVASLAALPDRTAGVFRFSIHLRAESGLAMIHEVQPDGEPAAQVDHAIPTTLRGPKDKAVLQSGSFFKTGLRPEIISQAHSVKVMEGVLRNAGHETALFAEDGNPSAMQQDQGPFGVLVLDCFNDPHCFILLNEQDLLPLARVRSNAPSTAYRTPENLERLSGKSVGIVGLGSVGSKVALCLARMGVLSFFLVDHDVFFPENVVRHELDWSNIGEHKVDGICERLRRIHADVKVEVSRLHLTGQESTAVVSGVLNALGQYDLLIDATANPHVFNLMTAVATAAQKPLVWMEVYGGGKGGMIARSRPGRDPHPQIMRAAYNQYCLEHPAPEFRTTDDYTTEDAEGQVLTASDADVAIIASHTARFAVDTVLGCDPSVYPYAMYLIGLARWWVFDAPFHTIPIATDHFLRLEAERKEPSQADVKNIEFISDLLRKSHAAASSS